MGTLLDHGKIAGRAHWCRNKAGFLGLSPPFSTRQLFDQVFPNIAVCGADLPRNVTEMAVADAGRRALYYAKGVNHSQQRVGLMHGLYHHMEDIYSDGQAGLWECNLTMRKLGIQTHQTDPLELACDLFAAEVLIPFDVLHDMTPFSVYETRDDLQKSAVDDEIDHLASRFNVPKGFMRWRLHDLHQLRRTHYLFK